MRELLRDPILLFLTGCAIVILVLSAVGVYSTLPTTHMDACRRMCHPADVMSWTDAVNCTPERCECRHVQE